MAAQREKFYTVSARLVFSSLIVAIIVLLVLGVSVAINHGPIFPLFGWGGTPAGLATTTVAYNNTTPIVIGVTCSAVYPYTCQNVYYNYTTGTLTVAISQTSGYNWTSVTVRFVPTGTNYSHGTPELSWSPPQAVNVTGGMLSGATKYVNIPISSGPIAVGSVITGSIWAKYQLQVGEGVSYANMSSAVISVKR